MKPTFVHYTLAPRGGMERYLCDVLKGCQVAGMPTRVVARKVDRELARTLGTEPVELSTFPRPRIWAKWAYYRKARAWVARHPEEPIVALARVPGATLAICGGNHLGYLKSDGVRGTVQDRLELYMERRAYATARRVVAHSRLMAGQLRELYGLPEERVTLLYPPVDTERFRRVGQEERQGLRRKFGFEGSQARIIFPSGNHLRKGLDLLVAAVGQLPAGSCEVVVAGGPPPRRLAGQVRHLGFVKNMEDLYAAGDATVMPSRYEPFGLVYVESLLCGTPAVVPATAGAAEVLADSGAVIIPTVEIEAVAEGIRQALARGRVGENDFVQRHGLSVAGHVRGLQTLLANSGGAR